ncbi:UxaA family hydrolase [Candidatus Solincola sp.]|nr:UxaA family hydrolase [Actinomycetota bacterium]MDI7251402.1 UxaA family hydrolase [Actinomycetota bacterium]
MSGKDTFLGYRRPDGRVGVRNHVAVLPSVACANGVASAIAARVPGAVAMLHGHGCGRGGEDLGLHYRTLTNLGRNPNIYGLLLVGLGCEALRAPYLAENIAASGKRVEYLEIQEVGGSRKAARRGVELAQALWNEAARVEREEIPLSEVVLGLECGGSDAFSGITANPSVGLVADWLVEKGGTVVLTETTEMIGTAHILERRAVDPETGRVVRERIEAAERRTREILGPFANLAIAPGNMDGGMSSIREKSLGCILKGGDSPVTEVVDYACPPGRRGLVIMDGPGYDVESMTGLAAAGCQVIIFTTGRGNPIGFPAVPVIKVASNTRLYEAMRDDMDVNAGTVLEGRSLREVARELRELLLRVLGGEPTRAEVNHQEGILCLYTTTPSL